MEAIEGKFCNINTEGDNWMDTDARPSGKPLSDGEGNGDD